MKPRPTDTAKTNFKKTYLNITPFDMKRLNLRL